jgi:hypothetical protein
MRSRRRLDPGQGSDSVGPVLHCIDTSTLRSRTRPIKQYTSSCRTQPNGTPTSITDNQTHMSGEAHRDHGALLAVRDRPLCR